MKIKLFTFRFSESAGGFNDESLQEFMADKEVIEFTEHFFVHERTPYLTVLVSYRSLAQDEKRRPVFRSDPREELDDEEKKAFDALKTWRAARAKQEGIPPYMIASNRQLAKMIRVRPASRAALGGIEGIGEAKTAKYGEEILQVLGKHPAQTGAETQEVESDSEK